MTRMGNGLLKNSHLAAVLENRLCGVETQNFASLLRLLGAFCGCDDLTIFEQPEFFKLIVDHREI